jgi:hypothetical protein
MTHSDLSLPGQVPLPQRRPPHRPGVKHISLSLQGGGSHSAFTWGVMHGLISEPRLYHRERPQRALRLPIIPNLSMPIGGKT